MDIFINTDKSPAQLQGKATGSPLSSFRVKRGASVPLSVTILGSDSASGLRMGIKAKGNYEGDLLILAEADSGTPTEYGMRFDLNLVASSVALNDVLDVGEGSATAPATIAAMTELTPILECIQNGASVGAIMGIFLWREVKRTEPRQTKATTRKHPLNRTKRHLACHGVARAR